MEINQANKPKLLIVGASARAAAQSAVAAGFDVAAIDLFGDADLRKICDVRVAKAWPGDAPRLAEQISPRDWMYTGALENYPPIIERISRRHRLLGCPAATVTAVRDPVALCQEINAAGFFMPETVRELAAGSFDGPWLKKPIRSAGGMGIHRVDHHQQDSGQLNCGTGQFSPSCDAYYQRELTGTPFGAVFLAAAGQGTRLWGVSRQLPGWPNAAGRDFQYCGSIGPVALPSQVSEEICSLGSFLAYRYSLCGVFGVDFVLVDGRAWLIEVNPRYTASAEVFERATGHSAIKMHVAACGGAFRELAPFRPYGDKSAQPKTIGKAILYATTRLAVSPSLSKRLLTLAADEQSMADIPIAGTVIEPSHPILTAFGSGTDAESCESSLLENLGLLRNLVAAG